jgi:hypothetical protein
LESAFLLSTRQRQNRARIAHIASPDCRLPSVAWRLALNSQN